jgi:hypothetical protein
MPSASVDSGDHPQKVPLVVALLLTSAVAVWRHA